MSHVACLDTVLLVSGHTVPYVSILSDTLLSCAICISCMKLRLILDNY